MKFLVSDFVLFRVQSMAGKFSFLGKNKIHHIEEKSRDRTLRGKCAFYREKGVHKILLHSPRRPFGRFVKNARTGDISTVWCSHKNEKKKNNFLPTLRPLCSGSKKL